MNNKENILAILSFLLLAILGIGKIYGFFVPVDNAIYSFFSEVQSSGATFFFSLITLLFNTTTFVVLSAALFAYLFYKDRKKDLVFAFSTLVGGSIIGSVLKIAFMQERPLGYTIQETGYSFPSGHAVKSVLFLAVLFFLFRQDIKSKFKRKIFASTLIIISGLVCLSRLYLGVHWLIDVLAGIAFATGWVSLVRIILEKEK